MEKEVSVIVPCRNERTHIAECLNSLLEQDYPIERLEIIIADGASEDGTAELIQSFAEEHEHVYYLNNKEKTVPYALNKAIDIAQGELIVRMDMHSLYPSNYISRLVAAHREMSADNVGASIKTLAANESVKAEAIAIASSNRFGVGGSAFRTGGPGTGVLQVDTVPFGCYRRTLFDELGQFDTELTRNQDDEFNGRLTKAGGKIFLLPNLEIKYIARPDWQRLWKMYYQYGLFKPLVARKLGKPASLRQLVPVALVISLLTLLIASVWQPAAAPLFFATLIIYLLAAATASWQTSSPIALQHHRTRHKRFNLSWHIFLSFLCLHFSYGSGYLVGSVKLLLGRSPNGDAALATNR